MQPLRQQRGDTLVEVTLATVILGMVLISCFQLGARALQLGIDARRRTQAANILQSQAEGLRSMRDSHPWSVFKGNQPIGFNCSVGSTFHVVKDPINGWQANSGSFAPVIDNNSPFTVSILVKPTTNCSTDNEIQFDMTATWPAASGPGNQTSLSTILVNEDEF